MKCLYIILLLLININVTAPANFQCAPEPLYKFIVYEPISHNQYIIDSIWVGVCYVETRFNHNSINHKEDAYGIAQIRQIRLDDYYLKTGIRYHLHDMLDSIKAKEVFDYYAHKNIALGTDKIIRKWNGSGPKTYSYYNKVNEYLLSL